MSASKALKFVHPFSAPPPVAGSKLAKLGNPRPALKTGIGIAAMLLLIVPLITVAADARGGGGGGGHGGGGGGHGGGGGGHVGGGGGHGGGFGGHSGGFARHGGGFAGRGGGLGIGTRSFQGARVGGLRGGARSRGVGRSISSPRAGIATARVGGIGNRFATAPARNLGVAGTHLRGANLGRGVFGIAPSQMALRSHFASARFQGRFSVRAGRGGAAVSLSAGSDRCSGPTLITTSSTMCIGLTPTMTSGRMPTTMSITASMAVMPIPAA